MIVVHWGKARRFFKKHPSAKQSLLQWRTVVQASSWKNFPDLRSTLNSSDWVDGKVVFNIKGTDYRLIALIDFDKERIYVRHVLTHEEYDGNSWKE